MALNQFSTLRQRPGKFPRPIHNDDSFGGHGPERVGRICPRRVKMTVHLSATSTRVTISRAASAHVLRNSAIVFLLALAAGVAMVFIGFRLQSLVDTKF